MSRPRALVVEDDKASRDALLMLVEAEGYEVSSATSLEDARNALKALDDETTVLLDLGLPDGDGMALVRQLSVATPPFGAVIALSGHDRADWRAEALDSGAAACLEKPIPSLAAFQDVILSVLPDGAGRKRDRRDFAVAGQASVRAAFADDMRRARALLADAVKGGDAETVAYCAQFLGSVAHMLGDRALARDAADPRDGAGLLASVAARLDAVTARSDVA